MKVGKCEDITEKAGANRIVLKICFCWELLWSVMLMHDADGRGRKTHGHEVRAWGFIKILYDRKAEQKSPGGTLEVVFFFENSPRPPR